MNVLSAIESDPVRAPPVFAATLKTTLPFPLPVAPDVIVSQGTLLEAVHWQLVIADTATLSPVETVAATVRFVGLMDTVQDGVGVGPVATPL